MHIQDFTRLKAKEEKISMVTCYDHWSASIINATSIHSILVGDSAAMVMHGHPTTVPATVELMVMHTAAVVRGAPDKFIIGDLPFMSYRKGLNQAMESCQALMQAGAHAVKLEGWIGNELIVEHAVSSGVPIVVHLGMTPQSIHSLGGFRIQSKTEQAASQLVDQALAAEAAGSFCLVLECVPPDVATQVKNALTIPAIGIGAGPNVDGQVLVLQDLLGMNPHFKPKFLRQYLEGYDLVKGALEAYHEDVAACKFPSKEECYPCLSTAKA